MRSHQYAKLLLMRTTIDLPDALLRQLKAKAALEGTTLKALLHNMVEHSLRNRASGSPASAPSPAALPSIRLGRPLNLPHPSNAALFDLLDD